MLYLGLNGGDGSLARDCRFRYQLTTYRDTKPVSIGSCRVEGEVGLERVVVVGVVGRVVEIRFVRVARYVQAIRVFWTCEGC